MPTPTYTLITEQIVTSAITDITFNNIPQIYSSLCLEVALVQSNSDGLLYVNGETPSTTNWGWTRVWGNGSTSGSDRTTNYVALVVPALSSSQRFTEINFLNYTSPNMFKNVLGRFNFEGGSRVGLLAGMWRNNAPITSFKINSWGGVGFNGSVVRLWGIVG